MTSRVYSRYTAKMSALRQIPIVAAAVLAVAAHAVLHTTYAAEPASAVTSERPPSLLRSALLVTDVERSRRFYELFGFRAEVGFDNPRDPARSPFPLASPSTRTRLVILSSASGMGGRIGLVEFSGPTPPDARRDASKTAIGDVVLVLDVADAEAIHRTLQKAQATIIEPPQVYVSRQRAPDGAPMQGKVFHVRDPDGYLIEILEPPTRVGEP